MTRRMFIAGTWILQDNRSRGVDCSAAPETPSGRGRAPVRCCRCRARPPAAGSSGSCSTAATSGIFGPVVAGPGRPRPLRPSRVHPDEKDPGDARLARELAAEQRRSHVRRGAAAPRGATAGGRSRGSSAAWSTSAATSTRATRTAPALRARMARKLTEHVRRRGDRPGHARARRCESIRSIESHSSERLSRAGSFARWAPSSGRSRPATQSTRYLRAQRPDAVLVTPVVEFASSQVEYVKSARKLGIPAGVAIASWDNLTGKGLIRVVPDRVFVWNETQAREAVEMHGIPPEPRRRHRRAEVRRVVRADAQRPRARPSPRRSGSIRSARSCSTPARRRSSRRTRSRSSGAGSPRLRERRAQRPPRAGRPRPPASAERRPVAGRRPRRRSACVVWPPGGAQPDAGEARADFFDSLAHSAARRRDQHERADRGGDPRQERARAARARVRGHAARHAALPLPPRSRTAASSTSPRRSTSTSTSSPTRSARRRARGADGRVSSRPSSGRAGSTGRRRRSSRTRSSELASAAPEPARGAAGTALLRELSDERPAALAAAPRAMRHALRAPAPERAGAGRRGTPRSSAASGAPAGDGHEAGRRRQPDARARPRGSGSPGGRARSAGRRREGSPRSAAFDPAGRRGRRELARRAPRASRRSATQPPRHRGARRSAASPAPRGSPRPAARQHGLPLDERLDHRARVDARRRRRHGGSSRSTGLRRRSVIGSAGGARGATAAARAEVDSAQAGDAVGVRPHQTRRRRELAPLHGDAPPSGGRARSPAREARRSATSRRRARTARRRAPTRAELVAGRSGPRSNHRSKSCAPVTTMRSAGSPCSSTASRRWISFQTNAASGTALMIPFVVRWSQLATPNATGIPSLRAAFTVSVCRRLRSLRPMSGVTRTASGACADSARSTPAIARHAALLREHEAARRSGARRRTAAGQGLASRPCRILVQAPAQVRRHRRSRRSR